MQRIGSNEGLAVFDKKWMVARAFNRFTVTGDRYWGQSNVIYCEETATFNRVAQPVEVTRQNILAIPELDDSFGDRLLRGE